MLLLGGEPEGTGTVGTAKKGDRGICFTGVLLLGREPEGTGTVGTAKKGDRGICFTGG